MTDLRRAIQKYIHLKDKCQLNAEQIAISGNVWLIAVKVRAKNFCGTIGSIYRSPNCDSNEKFFEVIGNWLQIMAESNENTILCGDINIDWLANNSLRDRIYKCINDNGFKQCVQNHTRINEESRTLIDYCITNCSSNIVINTNSELKISDHEVIVCEIKKS